MSTTNGVYFAATSEGCKWYSENVFGVRNGMRTEISANVNASSISRIRREVFWDNLVEVVVFTSGILFFR